MGTFIHSQLKSVTVVTVKNELLRLVLRFNLLIIKFVTVVTVKLKLWRPP